MRILQGIIMLFLVCCKPKPGVPIQSSNTDTVQFYQISQFVTTQVNDVKKTPYFIFKKTNINGRIDSGQIDNNQFEKLARQFEEPDISEVPLKKEYVESVFFDQTTKTYTLNYSTRNKELEVQNIDVLLNADGSTLKRIFIRKFFTYNRDSSAIEQLSWKPNEQFQISRVVQIPGQKEMMYQSTIVWNENKRLK